VFLGTDIVRCSQELFFVKGGARVRRGAGRSKAAVLPEDFGENAGFFTARAVVKAMAFSAERKGSVSQYGTVASDSTTALQPEALIAPDSEKRPFLTCCNGNDLAETYRL